MVNNPRIYIVIGTFLPLVGGAEKQALLQARSLHERGYEATILTFRHEKSWPSEEVIEGVPIIRVAGKLLAGREKLPRILQRLAYMLAILVMGWCLWGRRRHYDVLHMYLLTLLALPAAIVCRLTNKPMLVAVRCSGSGKQEKSNEQPSLIAGPLDPTSPWLRVEGQSWLDGDLEALGRMGRPAVRLTRSLLKSISAIVIVLSSRMKDYVAANDFALPGMQLIPNGVDTQRFQPAKTNTTAGEQAKVVVCISKLRYEKGIDVLLQAWAHLGLPSQSQTRLVIVGDGPMLPQFEQMARELGIAQTVEFAGLQSDIPAQLHRGMFAVLPSRWEGMPNAVLEAMACGLPCVATRVSGSEDIIQHGVNGLLVESEDYQALAQALLVLLRDPELARKYGRAARATIERNYSVERITDRYIELYQNLSDHNIKSPEQSLATEPTISHLY